MTVIFEKSFPKESNGIRRQFTSCCGASDKGLDDCVGCRSCYQEIYEYFGVGNEETFKEYINDSKIMKRFEEFLADTNETYEEWHANLMKKHFKEQD